LLFPGYPLPFWQSLVAWFWLMVKPVRNSKKTLASTLGKWRGFLTG